MASMRGLETFISDIRNCRNKDDEVQRVERELANVRAHFGGGKALTPYERRKYTWKLVYIAMLGYDVDFGHTEFIHLMNSTKFAEKLAGYTAATVLLPGTDDLRSLVVNAIRSDLSLVTSPFAQALALSSIAEIATKDLAAVLVADVQGVLFSSVSMPDVRKKAALALLRLHRANPDVPNVEELAPRLLPLLEERHLGLANAIMALVLGLARSHRRAFEGAVAPAVALLTRLALHQACLPDYVYYTQPHPWLQVRLFKLLQLFPPPASEQLRTRIGEIIGRIMSRTEVSRSVNKNNAEHAVLFEAMNLMVHQGDACDPKLRAQALTMLGKYVSVREPNIRYLALETMSRLVIDDDTRSSIKKHQNAVLVSLRDADVSIRKRALDLLYNMCDRETSSDIVREMLNYLLVADSAIKEEMVLKVAILAERFAPDFRWYIDTILKLVTMAGDFVSDDVWHRAVQIVSTHEDLQLYTAQMLYAALQASQVHETTVKVGGYVLGEYGYLLGDAARDAIAAGQPAVSSEFKYATGDQQLDTLLRHLKTSSLPTRAMLLTSLAKFTSIFPETRPRIAEVFEANASNMDNELQQRAVEYLRLPGFEKAFRVVMDAMPPFREDRESSLMLRLKRTTERAESEAWSGAPAAGDATAAAAAAAAAASSTATAPEGGAKSSRRVSYDDDDQAGGGDDDDDPYGGRGRGRALSGSAPPSRGAAASSSSSSSSSSSAGSGPTDLLGLSSTPEPAAPLRQVGLDPSLAGQMRKWFRDLLVRDKGVLYEDERIQIGCQHQYQNYQGRVVLFFGNKTTQQFTSFSATSPASAALRLQMSELQTSVAPRAQARQQVMAEAMQPFQDPPVLTVSFVCDGAQYTLPLRLPIMPSCFCGPVQMGGPDFDRRWKALEGGDREQVATAKAADAVNMAAVRALVSDGLKFAVIADSELASENSVLGVGTFRTGTPAPTGTDKLMIGCLIRIEGSSAAGAYRVTVRTTHAAVSLGLRNVVVSQLS